MVVRDVVDAPPLTTNARSHENENENHVHGAQDA